MSVTGKPLLVPGIGKVSGSVASFSDSNGKPLRSCIVTMEPIQSGEGDPSPDNIRPISGRTECSVYSAPSIITFEPTQSGTGTPSQENPRLIIPGLTFERDDGTTLTANGGSLDPETGVLTVTWASQTFSSSSNWGLISSGANSYIRTAISSEPTRTEPNAALICNYFTNQLITSTTTSEGVAITNPIDSFVRFRKSGITSVNAWNGWLDSLATPLKIAYMLKAPQTIQLTRTEVTRAVEALGVTPVTVQLGRTVYGGTLNVTTGLLTVTWVAVDGGSLNWAKVSNSYYRNFSVLDFQSIYQSNSVVSVLSDIYRGRSFSNAYADSDYYVWARKNNQNNTKELCVKDTSKAAMTAAQFKAAMEGVTFCYQLATPQTYQLTPEQISEATRTGGSNIDYSFHIDGSEPDPANAVTYGDDCAGFTPAHMDFTNDVFDYGSWSPDAFFMPRPCMLRYDGTVAYYLNPNNYAQKADGTPSDVANESFDGNAVMEFGRNGRRVWYKVVPDVGDDSSATVHIANYQKDSDYRCSSFVNNDGNMVNHFYVPIYNGSIDSQGRLRSLSGKSYSQLCQNKTVAQEVAAAELNNPRGENLWYTEVMADVTLINLLLILLGKSRDCQTVFGNGRQGQASAASSMLSTGTMNTKGLFWGAADNTHGVKCLGMENIFGNQWRRYAGHVIVNYVHKVKYTRTTADGSTAADYNEDGTGYLSAGSAPQTNNSVKTMRFDANGFVTASVGGTSVTYWCDYWYQNSGTRYALRGGACYSAAGIVGPFCVSLSSGPSYAYWAIGAAPSCKPKLELDTEVGANAVWSPDGDTTAEYYKKSLLFIG